MNNKEYFSIGYISKTRGLKGELQLYLEVSNPQDYIELESVLLEIHQKPVPFFVSKISLQKNIAYVYLEDIDHIDKSKPLVGKKVYIRTKDIPENTNDNTPELLRGFTVIDESKGELGEITEIQILPKQYIASLIHQGKEIMFPLHEQFILGIDQKNRVINVDLPEGLVDLYLEQ